MRVKPNKLLILTIVLISYTWIAFGGLTGCPAPPGTEPSPNDAGEWITNTEQNQPDTRSETTPPDRPINTETNPEPTPPDTPIPPDGNRPFGLTKRVPNTTCKLPGRPDALTSMKLVRRFPALSFQRPVFLTSPKDGTKRLFVVEQFGKIYVFPNKNNVTTQERKLFLDIGSTILGKHNGGGNEEGLLGLAFHPNFKQNRTFYIYYSARNPRRSVIASMKTSANDPDKADTSTEQVIMTVDQPYSNHNGGMLAFGPDGYLYISLGDGGSAADPKQHRQNLGTLLGSILRIDVNKQANGKNESLPADNPFVGQANAKDEIWAYGLRNVWRFSFDRESGDLWAGDVGQSQLEEIDIIVRGGNYGWRTMEGTKCFIPSTNCNKSGLILPIVEHGRSEAKSITGGYVYRGTRLPELTGAYIYGDYVTGLMWAIRYDGSKLLEQKRIIEGGQNIASFGEDENGELYILTFSGGIYWLEPNNAPPSNFPTTLSKTGCFSSLKPLQPAAGLIPYNVRQPLWSDGLDKQRWLALQNTDKITYKADGSWDMPNGSVIIKHFSYRKNAGDPNSQQHVETRFMVKQDGDWRGYTYKWNAQQTDAELQAGRTPVAINRPQPFTHIIPSRTDCLGCHTTSAGRILGLETLQMNRNYTYGNTTDNQLRAMNHIGLFDQTIPDHTQLPTMPSIDDTTKPAQDRVRAYLHANCSPCHQPGVNNNGEIDLRYTTSFKDTKTCNQPPKEGTLGVTGANIVTPGDPLKSILYVRMNTRGQTGQMPALGSVLKHDQALQLIRNWIQGLNQCP
jgi:uncharacterized repeat protein (TIGR03806 family)